MKRATSTPTRVRWDDMPCIHPNAAGMDIGASAIVVAVPLERDAEPVRVFGTFTPDLHALVDWLIACHIDTVAMEFTGISWCRSRAPCATWDHALSRQCAACQNRPGRKTDWNDAQWLQKLHTLGLWPGSFRLDAECASCARSCGIARS